MTACCGCARARDWPYPKRWPGKATTRRTVRDAWSGRSPSRSLPRHPGRVGTSEPPDKPDSVSRQRFRSIERRSSIWDARCRAPRAAYPELNGNEQPPLPAACAPESSPLLGLAPGGVCLAGTVAGPAGGLLHHPFTLTARLRGRAGPFAVCFLWHCSVGSPRLAVSQHRAL